MASEQESLSRAKSQIESGEHAAACATCQQVLQSEPESYEALCLLGKAKYYAGDHTAALNAYKKATDKNAELLPAWEGMAEIQLIEGNMFQAVDTCEQLLRLATMADNEPKQREWLWRLAEALDRQGNLEAAEKQLKILLSMKLTRQQWLETLCFLAEIQIKIEDMKMERRVEDHATRAVPMIESNGEVKTVKRTYSSARLLADAERADEQESEDGLAWTLKAIVKHTIPSPQYVRFHERHLKRVLARLGAYPPRSVQRNEKRIEALRECNRMISTSAGGCCTPFPYEAAIWLWEEREELCGGSVPAWGITQELELEKEAASLQRRINWYRGDSIRGRSRGDLSKTSSIGNFNVEDLDDLPSPRSEVVTRVEEFGMKLAHQFPWLPSSSVAVGLALRRRFLSDPNKPSTSQSRKQIAKCLKKGVENGADSAAGWKALAELQYQNREWQAAYDTAVKGLEWSVKRRHAGHETLGQFALALRLVVAQCLRRLGKLDEAEYACKILAGWVTEGDAAFCELAGSPPLSIRQQALRGIAKVALARGDRATAKWQYERILGKVLMGRGPPAEHWAHSEYAWLLFEDGDLANAKHHLDLALTVAQKQGCAVTDSEIAEHHYKLGRICYTMGGNHMQEARNHFEESAMEQNDFQASACEWLGHWYKEVAGDTARAENCYRQALLLDPDNAICKRRLENLEKSAASEADTAPAPVPTPPDSPTKAVPIAAGRPPLSPNPVRRTVSSPPLSPYAKSKQMPLGPIWEAESAPSPFGSAFGSANLAPFVDSGPTIPKKHWQPLERLPS